jgi:hypothetical protein
LFSNGSNRLYYFINNYNGTLQGPNYIDFQHPISQFKIKQLNERGIGYLQNDPDDRPDFIFLDTIAAPNKVYAYKNNATGFTDFDDFSVDYPALYGLVVTDLDNDGYNDITVICAEGRCPALFSYGLTETYRGSFFIIHHPGGLHSYLIIFMGVILK